MAKYKTFDIFVIIFVVLTGAGFGVITGLAYWQTYWWVGMITGAASGFPLAKLYLKQLAKISTKGHKRTVTWLLSTFVAIICGVICTTLIHAIMILIIVFCSDMSLMELTEGFWEVIFLVGEGVGAGAGLIVGGICSLIYVLSLKGNNNAAS